MKKILMTGGTGFVGQNVLSILQKQNAYLIYAPKREELNLKNEQTVVEYLTDNHFDVILHFANPTPGKNPLDSFDTLMEDGLRIFMNFYNHQDLYGKMIYTGSGAEYDKTKDMDLVTETECYRSVPGDAYGLSKMLMNQMAEKSDKVYNFRIFGCYGPNDHESKFITHCIRSVILDLPITIRKDCYFDYIHVYDFARFIMWGIENNMSYHSYNITSGTPILLSELAKKIILSMDSKLDIQLLSQERNRNYTANNSRILNESKLKLDYPIEKGILEQIKWEKENWNENTKFDGE